jgi:hypothetical protein
MRHFILLVFIFIFCNINAQEVAGVSFGMSYDQCKAILDKKFNNGKSSYQSESNKLNYHDVLFAGVEFQHLTCEFQSDKKKTHLNFISFQKRFDLNDVEVAKTVCDGLFDLYSRKYDNGHYFIRDDGFKQYVFPYGTIQNFINIVTLKGKSKGGEMYIWTLVNYGPIDVINPTSEI